MTYYNHSIEDIANTMEEYQMSEEDAICYLDECTRIHNSAIFHQMRIDEYADSEGDSEY